MNKYCKDCEHFCSGYDSGCILPQTHPDFRQEGSLNHKGETEFKPNLILEKYLKEIGFSEKRKNTECILNKKFNCVWYDKRKWWKEFLGQYYVSSVPGSILW